MTKLIQRLGFFTTFSVIVGTMIGSGIFKKSSPMAELLGSQELLLFVWLIAGLVTLIGALSNAEIASMFPQTGGQFKFFQVMYGDKIAYLYGWSIFTVIQTGSIASIAFIFSEYLLSIFHSTELSTTPHESISYFGIYIAPFLSKAILLKIITCIIIIILTWINHRGVHVGGSMASIFSVLKISSILLIILSASVFQNSIQSIEHSAQVLIPPTTILALIIAFIAAMSKAFWAYDGWNSITYIAGEIKDAQNIIPKALVSGVSAVIVLYLLINIAYIKVLPLSIIAHSPLVAADVMNITIGKYGANIIAAIVMISTLGATNNTILSSARAHYALAKEGLFFAKIANVHPTFLTPSVSLWVQCGWSVFLVITSSFDTLTDMLIFVSWIFYGMSAYGVILLRKRMPNVHRPYKVPLYPLLPILFVGVSIVFVLFVLWGDIIAFTENKASTIPSLNGLILTLSGLPFYYWFDKKRKHNQGEYF